MARATKRGKNRSPRGEEDSTLEAPPSGSKPATRRTIGTLDEEETVNLDAPAEVKKGRRKVRRGSVGLRAASGSNHVSEKAVQVRNEVRQKVREERDKHRQRVWDKLDAARQKADERASRLDRFRPGRARSDDEG